MAFQQPKDRVERSEQQGIEFSGEYRCDSEAAEATDNLMRSLRRKQGFGLFFVQCSPEQGQQVIRAIREHLPQKRVREFALTWESETLYAELREAYRAEPFEVACIMGVEQALHGDGGEKIPPLLSHLNRQREIFEANLAIALVFLVPSFAVNSFVRQAPDFFDWRSGFFRFISEPEDMKWPSEEEPFSPK